MYPLLLFYIVLSVGLALGYSFVMWQYIRGWEELEDWNVPLDDVPKTMVTVLIPARNEAENIVNCLQSVVAQHYPKTLLEVIVLDDHSTDETARLVKQFEQEQVRLISLSERVDVGETQSFKKKAIEIGVAEANGTLIVTTDADCVVGKNWIQLLVSFYESKQLKFIAAPVNFYQERNALERFQSLDFMGMMGIAGGGIQRKFMRMCNGANLAYEKATFYAVNGFEGIDQLASGDDMLLMQKVAARYPNGIGYLKNRAATVYTHAKPTLKSFSNQRIRWSTKSSSYRESLVTFILALVFFFCCNIVFSFVLSFFIGKVGWYIFTGSLLTKALMDYWFLGNMSRYFQRTDLMQYFLTSFFLHIAYIVVVGSLANLKTEYEWKGRRVR